MSNDRTLRSADDLIKAELAPAEKLERLRAVAERYAIAITPHITQIMAAHEQGDALAKQFVPDERELHTLSTESEDPIGDARHSPITGIVHRYPDRVLLKPTHTCAVYCRFCFRREVVGPGGAGSLSQSELDSAIAYIASHAEVWEVIITGGDPLLLSPRRLADIIQRLSNIPHVRVVRFHTRIPVVQPAIVTDELISAISSRRVAVYVALHANHPSEMNEKARSACGRIIDAGIPMLSQTVLLRGVNDEPGILGALMRAFVETRIKPYYLHHGDHAPGTSHFRTTLEEGQKLVQALRGRLSGLCQPTYILDIPEGYGKVPVGPCYSKRTSDGSFSIEDPWGEVHDFRD